MLIDERASWLEFCQWLFAQPAAIDTLRAINEPAHLHTRLIELARANGWSFTEAQLETQIRQLQLHWLQRCL